MKQAIESSSFAAIHNRAGRLVEAIKNEVRWILLSTSAATACDISEDAAAERRRFIRRWPDIRNKRLPSNDYVEFYTLVSDQASSLAHLIELRRLRERNRSGRQ